MSSCFPDIGMLVFPPDPSLNLGHCQRCPDPYLQLTSGSDVLLGQPASLTPLLLVTIPDRCSAAFSKVPQTQRDSRAGHHHCFCSPSSFREGCHLGLLWVPLPSCLQGLLPLDFPLKHSLECLGLRAGLSGAGAVGVDDHETEAVAGVTGAGQKPVCPDPAEGWRGPWVTSRQQETGAQVMGKLVAVKPHCPPFLPRSFLLKPLTPFLLWAFR